MNSDTLLLRQVHPTFVQNGQITSQVFRPTPKDENLLSAYNGDLITAGNAWKHYTSEPANLSVGVMAISKGECDTHQLPVIEDKIPFVEHVSIDFTKKTKSGIEKIAKMLKRVAQQRGWLFELRLGNESKSVS
jgi:hypothetical protein